MKPRNKNAFLWPRSVAGVAIALFLGGCAESSEGLVTVVDKAAQRITIAHDGVAVAFHAKDPAMLSQVEINDRVAFEYDRISGKFTITKVEKKPKPKSAE